MPTAVTRAARPTDLVFIHDGDADSPTTANIPIDGGTFLARLGQRITHIFTAQSSFGPLYEVDMLLRPSGNAGLLVAMWRGYSDYAAPPGAGLGSTKHWFGPGRLPAPQSWPRALGELRREVLCRARDAEALRREVVEIREKMRNHLGPKADGIFDLKHSLGGIIDIEFLIQYLVLAFSAGNSRLVRWADNIRILEVLQQKGLLSPSESDGLIDACKRLRTDMHRLGLLR